MNTKAYRYTFGADVSINEVRSCLVLAVMSVESLHGVACVRLDAAHTIDEESRQFVIDASTCVGRDLNRLFVGYVDGEIGADAFRVERVTDRTCSASSHNPSLN